MKTLHAEIAGAGTRQVWLKKLGLGGFLFFLLKGLLWLTLPAMLALAGLE